MAISKARELIEELLYSINTLEAERDTFVKAYNYERTLVNKWLETAKELEKGLIESKKLHIVDKEWLDWRDRILNEVKRRE